MLPPELQKIGLFPVERLDKDTRGLLLLTNNGDYAHKVITPKYHIEKRYHAKTDGVLSEETVEAFRNGMFENGDNIFFDFCLFIRLQ